MRGGWCVYNHFLLFKITKSESTSFSYCPPVVCFPQYLICVCVCLRVCLDVVGRICWLPWLLRPRPRGKAKARSPLCRPSSRSHCSTVTWRLLWTKNVLAALSWRMLCRRWEQSCDLWERKVSLVHTPGGQPVTLALVYYYSSIIVWTVDNSLLSTIKQCVVDINKRSKFNWLTILTPALQYKDHGNSANPATARQQMIMSAMVKSPEHQQGPTSLGPSNSGRRKETTPTPEGEWEGDVYWGETFSLSLKHTCRFKAAHLMHIGRDYLTYTQRNPAIWSDSWRIIHRALTLLFLSHTFQREGGSLLKVSCPNS